MKSLRSALLLMVCLAFLGNVPAEARPASHSGTSKSFKSGFSSQKNNSAAHSRQAPPANRQSGPGAFGKQAGSPAQQRNTSAMSRDVDQGASRERALRTLDERRAAANAPQPLPPLNDTLRQPQQPAPQRPAPAYGAPPYAGPSPVYAPPAQPSNGLMAGVLGFMLGRAMSQSNQPVAYPTTSGNQPVPAASAPAATGATAAPGPEGAGMVAGMPGLGAPSPAAAPAPAPSFMSSVLRLFAWLSVISLLGWAAVYSVRKFRRLRAAPNYSFERN
ncbi:hypothetical protein GTP45_22070 [Pseudoduganella sp. FT55W]|uniref:Transmembrane protein n=1 Tax=Duganella rivi TaxID=2666083 RepID=A0A7X4GTN9_9BURK|nr:hypothetical protein [Duganella rivi]MYM69507.1 hypothetical protein [Duganella rivi]